jgi:hypothetical protein
MTILLTLWRILTGNKLARTIGAVLMAVAGVLTFGAIKKREGAQAARADAAVKAAKAERKGAEEARKGRADANADLAKGKTPEEIRRQNDGKW